MPIKIGFLHALIRQEEKYLLDELATRPNLTVEQIDIRKLSLPLGNLNFDHDIFFDRCLNHSKGSYILQILEGAGYRCVNSAHISTVCGDKLLTSIALVRQNIPHLPTVVAFSTEEALQVMERLGYPVVLKPLVGSWGRLLAKVNDRDAAEALLEHKSVLGSYHHSIFYIQKYLEKTNRDIRAVVINGECVAALYRVSDHWITNTARGARVEKCPITPELKAISEQAANAVGRGIIAVDLFETEDGYLVNELNSTLEFRNSIHITGVNIPALIVDYLVKVAEEQFDGNG